MEVKSVLGVMLRRSGDKVFAKSWLGLLAWLAAAWVSPAIAHYPESDKRVTAPGQGYVQPVERTKLRRKKLLASDLSITTERFSARNNRVNLAIIGDGYQQAELESLYQPTVRDTLDYFLTHPKSAPYPRYRNFLNIFRIDIPSNDSGVDDLEAGIERDTALDGENGCTDWTIGICGADWALVHEAFDLAEASAGFIADWRLVLLNDDSYNAAAHYPADGTLPIYSAHYKGRWDMRDIALHEGAHAWHYLADEYGGDAGIYPYAEPSEVNVTTDSSGAKWSEWLEYVMPDGAVVGAYEGGRYYDRGIYRPTISSKMNGGPADCHYIGNDCGHNAIAIQKIILDIYRMVRPMDDHTPNEELLIDPEAVAVKLIDPAVIKVDWLIDGQSVSESGSETLVLKDYLQAPGTYQITAHAYDEVVNHAFSNNASPHPLDLVRRDLFLLQQTVFWEVEIRDDDQDGAINIGDNCTSDANSDQADFDEDQVGDACDSDVDNDGVANLEDEFPFDADEWLDSDGDAVGDNADAFPFDPTEVMDTDGDGLGNNSDADDDGDGFSDAEELVDGTDPLSRFSCNSGCFNLDVDGDGVVNPLSDGLLMVRYLFGFREDALVKGAVSSEAVRVTSSALAEHLAGLEPELDVDGDGERRALTDGLLLIRYLFGFSGESLVSGALAPEATRRDAKAIADYLEARRPSIQKDG